MSTEIPTTDPATATPDRRWQRGLLAGALLVGLALGSTALVMAMDDRGPAPQDVAADGARVDPEAVDGELPDDTPAGDEEFVEPMPGGMAMCAVVYSPETLVERELVFVGTVLSITGDAINFEVEEVLKGEPGDQAQLGGAEFLTTPNPDNVNPIAVGDRLLVAGDGGFAWGCGFTHPYDEDVAAEWRAAFAG